MKIEFLKLVFADDSDAYPFALKEGDDVLFFDYDGIFYISDVVNIQQEDDISFTDDELNVIGEKDDGTYGVVIYKDIGNFYSEKSLNEITEEEIIKFLERHAPEFLV